MKAPSNLEDLAFGRVVDLAPLVKSRAVSSTDLTKMYLARMKKYSPKLLCLITLTEDLALEQAAHADQEIRAGNYRGPLHGIPFGAQRSLRYQGHPDHVGRGAVSRRACPIRTRPWWSGCAMRAPY